jgi:hypothetical protein
MGSRSTKILTAVVTTKNETNAELQERIAAANGCYFALQMIF